MEFISYLSLVGLALATILLYVSGVKENLCWHSLPDFQNSFMICMMLKGVSAKYREPDICLPVTHDILHQMCQALPCIISDWYLVVLYHSMLTLAFNGMLRLAEFAYSLHVVRIENIIFDGQGVILYFLSSKTHQLPFCQHVRIKPQA